MEKYKRKIDEISSYYKKFDKEFEDYKRLGWESKDAHMRRFGIFADNVDLHGKKLLDVGCGLGNLYGYLKQKGVEVDYTGVDILEKMIEDSISKYPEAKFLCMDIFKENTFSEGEFDVIYASGIFNLNLGNNLDFLNSALELFFILSKDVVCFNLLHVKSPNREERYFYMSPDKAEEIARNKARYPIDIRILENYLDNDFTVICERKK